MSNFDPQAFLDAQITEPFVKRPPLPVGEYTAVIGEVTARTWQGKADPSKSGIAWDVPLAVEVPAEIQTALGMSQSTINLKDGVMLDLTEGGLIDQGPGRNRKLRNYREATNLNKAGEAFSARKLTGQIVRVKITHDIWEGEPIEKVAGVSKA